MAPRNRKHRGEDRTAKEPGYRQRLRPHIQARDEGKSTGQDVVDRLEKSTNGRRCDAHGRPMPNPARMRLSHLFITTSLRNQTFSHGKRV
jgi:hypothetical protein